MKLDPRTKLLLIATLTTLAVFALDVFYLMAVLLTTIIVNILLKADILSAIKRLKTIISLIIFIAIVQSLTVKEGASLIKIANFNLITTGGLLNGAEFALRMGIIIFASVIASTEKGRGMIDALIKLKIPYEIAFMVSVTIRFIPVFRNEFAARLTALKLRGIDIKKLKFNKKLKAYSYLLAPAVTGSMLKSRTLAAAMESRGFRAYKKRTMLSALRLKYIDYAVIIITIAYIAAFIYASFEYGGII